MKRKREPRARTEVQLLPENWSLVRSYWTLLLLWDQWRGLLVGLERQAFYVGTCDKDVTDGAFVFIQRIARLQWHGNRIGALICGPSMVMDDDCTGMMLEKYRVVLMCDAAESDRDYDEWLDARVKDDEMKGVLTSYVRLK